MQLEEEKALEDKECKACRVWAEWIDTLKEENRQLKFELSEIRSPTRVERESNPTELKPLNNHRSWGNTKRILERKHSKINEVKNE